MISFIQKGDFKNLEKYLKQNSKLLKIKNILNKYGKLGVQALSSATPVDSGLTAASWSYEVIQNGETFTIKWKNSNVQNGANIAILLQYGHATGNGGYVSGIDYINPAMKPVFKEIEKSLWEEIKNV